MAALAQGLVAAAVVLLVRALRVAVALLAVTLWPRVRLLLVAARPLGEPIARYGPFVMNTRQEILQALTDFSEGRLG